jgi:uncharacterized delta-60 repeat protein
MAVRPDGRILLTGVNGPGLSTDLSQPITGSQSITVSQLTANGTLDSSFGTNGVATVSFPVGVFNSAEPRDIAVQPDGRVIVAGSVVSDTHTATNPSPPSSFRAYRSDFAVIRLTPDGQLDPTFGDGGRVRIASPAGPGDNLSGGGATLEVLPDGSIALGGVSNLTRYEAARLLADGRLDLNYAGNGVVVGTMQGHIGAVGIFPDGRVVVADSLPFNQPMPLTDFLGLTADGQQDPEFDSASLNHIILASSVDLRPRAPAVLPDGDLVLVGTSGGQAVAFQVFGRAAAFPVDAGSILVSGTEDGTARPIGQSGGVLRPTATVQFFPGFSGTVRTATTDVNGDGVPDLIAAAGPGGGPAVAVIDGKTGADIARFFAYEPTFTGGLYVAAADLNGDGKADLVITPDQGGGPIVAVYDGAKLADGLGAGAEIDRFYGIADPAFRGGARPALGDLNGDGAADLVVSAGFLGGPRIAIFDGKDLAAGNPDPAQLVPDFFAFEDTLRNGAFVAVGDVDGDGKADLVFGGGPGGGPRVRVISGAKLLAAGAFATLDDIAGSAQLANFFAGDSTLRGGVHVAVRDVAGTGKSAVVTGSGDGEPSQVQVYLSANVLGNAAPTADQTLDPFGATLPNGVFVG